MTLFVLRKEATLYDEKKLTFLAAGAVVAAGMLAAIQASSFNLPLPSSASTDPDPLQMFRQHAPADTLYYFETKMDHDAFLQASNMQLVATQMEMTLAQIKDIDEVTETPAFQFFNYLLRDFVAQAKKGDAALIKRYGLTKTMASAFYVDGLAPVMQLTVADQEAFIKVIDKASAASGLKYRQESWNGKPVLVWKTPKVDAKLPPIAVAMALAEGNVTISLVRQDEDVIRKMQRLALAPELKSVADSKVIDHLRATNNYTDAMLGYVNFIELANTLLNPTQSSAGKDLLALHSNYTPPLDGSCADEAVGLVKAMPRLVFGYERFMYKDGILDMGASAVLELIDQNLMTEIKKLNGHLATHVTRYDDKLLAFGMGLDVSAFLPVITQLQKQFVQAQFQCPQLQMAQEQVKSANPATLAMATAMLQGMKGVGVSVYDLELTDFTAGQLKADVLLTVTAESPTTLAALLGNLPGMQGITVPADGSAVALNLPLLGGAMNPQLAIRGKNLTLFTGAKSAAAADASAEDTINSKGLLGYSGDYQRIGKALEKAVGSAGQFAGMNTAMCIELYTGIANLMPMDMRFNAVDSFTDRGFEMRMDSQWNTHGARAQGFMPGNYRIEQMTEGCRWQPVGLENINAEGTGMLKVKDKVDACDIYVADYQWQREGAHLSFTETKAMNRQACADEWVEQEPMAYSCIITSETENGFSCLFSSPERELYRYTLN